MPKRDDRPMQAEAPRFQRMPPGLTEQHEQVCAIEAKRGDRRPEAFTGWVYDAGQISGATFRQLRDDFIAYREAVRAFAKELNPEPAAMLEARLDELDAELEGKS